MCRGIRQAFGHGPGQFTGGVYGAQKHIGQRVAAFRAVVPAPDQGRCFFFYATDVERGAANHHHHGVGVYFQNLLDQFLLSKGQLQVRPVGGLCFIIAVRAGKNNGNFSAFGRFDGLLQQFRVQLIYGLHPLLGHVPENGFRLGGIPLQVSFGIADRHRFRQPVLKPLQGGDLPFGLHPGPIAAQGVLFGGIGPDDRDGLHPLRLQGEEVFGVL